jgi:hypothetical protein
MALFASGCSDFVDQDQARVDDSTSTTLEASHPVGQTFVAQHGGLEGMEVWLAPEEGSEGEVSLYLRSELRAETDLATASLSLAEVTNPGFYRFSFPALRESHSRYYYAFLETTGESQVLVGKGPGDAYLDGALYWNHEPLDAQMAFRLVYNPALMALELAGAAVRGGGLLAVAGLLYVVPGWAMLELLWHEPLSWAEKLGLGAGLSLALYPLFLLWTDLVGLRLGSLYAWLPVLAGAGTLIWRNRNWRPRTGWESVQQWLRSDAFWPDVALMVVTSMVFAVRLLVVRTLSAPMWGDSYQHTMIAQLLVDNGGLFDSWEPYAPLESFTYHFGFHSLMAALHWMTGMAMHESVLWGAQILNGLAVLVLYPLALRVNDDRWAGVGAVLVAGLLSPMPMFYVNWGRYTQLAGQAILPAAVLITWSAVESMRWDWRLFTLGWIAVSGLALTHYRVLIFYAVFVLAWILTRLCQTIRQQHVIRAAWMGLGALGLSVPWFVQAFKGEILRLSAEQLAIAPGQLPLHYDRIGDLARYLAPGAWLLLGLSMVIGLWRRRPLALVVTLWCFLLLATTNPRWLHLPGTGMISNFALFIAAYIPAGVMIGYLLGLIATWIGRQLRFVLPLLLIVGIGVGGIYLRMGDIHIARHTLVTRPDSEAMTWIRENTPENANFLINSFPAYQGSMVVGSDGGWWLPLLAGRGNTVPPLNYGMEQVPLSYREEVSDLTQQIQKQGLGAPATLALLQERGITHVYVGQQQGRVNYSGPHTLDPQALLRSAAYRPLYHRDRVWVFEVIR